METRVRRARPEDADRIASVGRRAFVPSQGAAFAPEDLAAYLARAFDPAAVRAEIAAYFVLEVAGAIAGVVKLAPSDPPACVADRDAIELSRVAIDPELEGRGHGAALVESALADGARGFVTCWLHVWLGNPRAIAFYERLGWKRVGEMQLVVGGSAPIGAVMVRALR